MDTTIPERITRFIAKYIPSIGILEILVVFYEEPEKEWTALAVTQAVRMELSSVEARMDYLISAELLTARTMAGVRLYRYGPSTAELADTIDELIRWYSSHRVAIISLVYSNPSDRR